MLGAHGIERDYSHYVSLISRTTLALVGTASKGPVGEAVVVTSTTDLLNKFGALNPDHYALYAAQYFLSQASKLYFVRAAGESLSAASVSIVGIDTTDTEVKDALIIEMLDKGTHANNYTLTISSNAEGYYDLLLKNSKGATLESIKELALEDIVAGYTTQYMTVSAVDNTIASLVVGDHVFSGGNDGVDGITSGDYITASEALKAKKIDINLIATPGVSDPAVIVSMLNLAEYRGDSLYLVDPPKGLTRDGVIQWVDGAGIYEHTAFTSNYGALYFDWMNIYDSANKKQIQVPPSVLVCATYAYSDRVSELWMAPAGLTRGIVRGAISPVTSLTEEDVDLLYDHHINCIYEDPQVGNVVWGQKTLYRENTALDRVNVRRLMNYLKKVTVAACNYLTFDPNDRVTWNSFEMKVLPILETIKNRRGLYEYKVIKGTTIVTEEDIDNYRMPCMILIRPTKSAEEIPIYFVITSTGADFNEVLDANGIM